MALTHSSPSLARKAKPSVLLTTKRMTAVKGAAACREACAAGLLERGARAAGAGVRGDERVAYGLEGFERLDRGRVEDEEGVRSRRVEQSAEWRETLVAGRVEHLRWGHGV